MSNLLELLEQSGGYNYFLKACNEGGLVDMLSHEGDWTLFVPDDDAFKKLPSVELKALFEEPSRLMNMVLLHSVEWGLTTNEIMSSRPKKLRTLGEDDINLKIKKKSILIENAKIIKPDIYADNGVIHIIDEVILSSDLWGH
jgi:uncharacterized surface protein with fasciclin (FAS1) repeats